MSARIQWWGQSRRGETAEGFILRRARGEAAEPNDLPLGRATREERIRALVRCELRCTGDKQVARLLLHPGRIVDAVDTQPHVPPSGIFVDRVKNASGLLECRDFREKKHDDLTEDEKIVADEMRQETLGFWAGVFRNEERFR